MKMDWREYITQAPWLEHKVRAKEVMASPEKFTFAECSCCKGRKPADNFDRTTLVRSARKGTSGWCKQCQRRNRKNNIKRKAAKGKRKFVEMLAQMGSKRIKRVTPPWSDLKAIAAVYAERDRLTEKTGVPHHVDHIIPIKGERVTGLHVAANLRVIPATENIRKNNKFNPKEWHKPC